LEQTMWLGFSILLLASYLVGSIPVAYLLIKIYRGVDIRNYGSGGVGGSNVYRSFSKPLGILVSVFDAGKGALMVWIGQLFGLSVGFQVAIGLAVIIGHNWSVFLRFNAGRGVATSLGVYIILVPWLAVIIAASILMIVLTDAAPVVVLIGMAIMPIASWLFHEPLIVNLGLCAIFVLMILRRLTAPRTDQSKSLGTGELLINRLLFDRDTRAKIKTASSDRLSSPAKKTERVN